MTDEQDRPEQEEESLDPLALFPEEIRRPVAGLMYLGQLTETVNFCGHSFGIRTLRPADKFAISIVLQPYRNTIFEVDVFQALHVGLALTEVDGDQNFCPPIGPNLEDLARARLNYLSGGKNGEGGWYPPTIEFLWSRYMLLEALATKGIQELDSLSRGGQPTNLPPWLDSLIAQGTSTDETSSETPPSTPFSFA